MIDLNVKHKISLKFKEQIRVAKITIYSSYFTVTLAVVFSVCLFVLLILEVQSSCLSNISWGMVQKALA